MKLASLPKVPLAHLPTPLEEASNLTAALGGPRILIKRDDLTGLALGGNKTRKLEYLIADAKANDATVVITTGGHQSNHCRQTAAAARLHGMRCVLVMNSDDPNPEVQGNLLLDYMLGADIRLVKNRSERIPTMNQVAEELRAQGEVPYIIPGGGSNPIGASSYVAAVFEIMEQLAEMGVNASHLYLTASTSGGTHAGTALGAKIAGDPFQVIGVSCEQDVETTRDVVVPLANATAEYLGTDIRLERQDLIVDDRYTGAGYGIPTPECLAAIKLAAQTEALLLDPVYTGKAFAGLIDHVKTGQLSRDDTVIFLHSGGIPALFADAEDVLEAVRS